MSDEVSRLAVSERSHKPRCACLGDLLNEDCPVHGSKARASARDQARMAPTIVAAFPATGKSFVAGRDHRFVDSDSSRFSWVHPESGYWTGVRERHPDWPGNYIAHIRDVIAPGAWVLTSTHAEVRSALKDAGLAFTLVYPDVALREEYRARMRDRGSPSSLVSKVIDELWDDALAECAAQTGCEHVVLGPGRYLADVLPRIVNARTAPVPAEPERMTSYSAGRLAALGALLALDLADTPHNDTPTKADLTRELHYMQTQAEQHGYPGTRAVLAELERLRTENAKLRGVTSDDATRMQVATDAVARHLTTYVGAADIARAVLDALGIAITPAAPPTDTAS